MQVPRFAFALLYLVASAAPCFPITRVAHAQQSSPGDSPLSGPSVKEPGVPGNSTTFTGGGRREGERVIDHRTFLKALDTLRASPDATLHLTADQEAQLVILFRDFRLAQRAYFEKNLNDIRDLRQVLEIKGDLPPTESSIKKGLDDLRRTIVGEENTTDQPLSDEAVKQAAREKSRRIYEGAPRAGSVHVNVWKLLTAPQRDALNDIINTLVAQQEAQRREFLSPESMTAGMNQDAANMNANMSGSTNGSMNSAINDSMMNGAMNASTRASAASNSTPVADVTTQPPASTNPNDPASLLGLDPAKISPTDPRLPERVRRRIRGMKPALQIDAIARYQIDLKEELRQAHAAASKDKSAAPTVDKVNVPTPEKK